MVKVDVNQRIVIIGNRPSRKTLWREAGKTLSIRQPYVELILRGKKRQEYRSRPTHIRGRVYLYAGIKSGDDEWAERNIV